MNKRTDIHRPSAIIPEDYSFVAFEHQKMESIGDCFLVNESRDTIARHMARTGGQRSQHEHGGNCHICGAGCVWTALFYHEKTNTYIRTGIDCADKLEMGYGDYNAFKRNVTNALEAVAGKRKAQAYLADKGLSRCWDIYTVKPETFDCECLTSLHHRDCPNHQVRGCYEENTIIDIVGKLIRYGSISEKTEAFAARLLQTIDNRPVVAAQRAAEQAQAEDCPTGKVQITGEVLSTKIVENAYGSTLKMLVKDTRGFKVFGTVPGNLDVKRGSKVSFYASVEKSGTDSKFGFFKRPTRATQQDNLQLDLNREAC